jgi:hypothetical protein
VTAIRYAMAGRSIRAWAGPGLGIARIDGDRWLPYQPATFRTPPFAEYVSGHSTFSMAAATVLTRFTGGDAYGEAASTSARETRRASTWAVGSASAYGRLRNCISTARRQRATADAEPNIGHMRRRARRRPSRQRRAR